MSERSQTPANEMDSNPEEPSECHPHVGPIKEDKTIVVYRELSTTYNKIRDFRAKLLGFLPLASGGGIFLLLENPQPHYLIPIGLVGFIVTVGLYFYERHNMNHCLQLIDAGKCIESKYMQLGTGQFKNWNPKNKNYHEFAAACIYGSVGIGWAFVALIGFLCANDWTIIKSFFKLCC